MLALNYIENGFINTYSTFGCHRVNSECANFAGSLEQVQSFRGGQHFLREAGIFRVSLQNSAEHIQIYTPHYSFLNHFLLCFVSIFAEDGVAHPQHLD